MYEILILLEMPWLKRRRRINSCDDNPFIALIDVITDGARAIVERLGILVFDLMKEKFSLAQY